jgi:hypothetical protein
MPITDDFVVEDNSKSYPDIPQGSYTLEIYDITNFKDVTFDTRNRPDNEKVYVTKLKVEFAILDDKKIKGEEEATTRGRRVWKNISPFVSYAKGNKSPSNLYLLFKAVYGPQVPKLVTPEELKALIGKQVIGMVKNREASNGKSYPEISFESLIEADELLPSYLTDKENPANKEEVLSEEDMDKALEETPF